MSDTDPKSTPRMTELDRLRREIATLERDRRRLPKLALLALLAIPAALVGGALAAGLVIAGTAVLMAIASYIVWTHLSDRRERLARRLAGSPRDDL